MNLAPLFYLNILSENNGPIENIVSIRKRINFIEYGYQSTAYLSKSVGKLRPPDCYLYSNSDGTGSDEFLKISTYKSISEALERWCFYETHKMSEFGFDIDPTSNGMSAYPSIVNFWAKENAYLEAFERWSLIQWWFGHLSNTEVIKLEYGNLFYIYVEKLNIVTAVLYTQCSNGRYCYGFSGGKTKELALKKALIEFKRNFDLVSHLDDSHCLKIRNGRNMYEKRTVYFSEVKGHLEFLDRIDSKKSKTNIVPKLIVDNKIKGPWSKYAIVWRCLFEPIEVDNLLQDNIFLF